MMCSFVVPFDPFAGFTCKLLLWGIWVFFHCSGDFFNGFQLLVGPVSWACLCSARKWHVGSAAVISKAYLETWAFLKQLAIEGTSRPP